MAQHLWHEVKGSDWRIRVCEVCDARQITCHSEWPRISPICPGDPDDAPPRVTRRRPLAPAGGTPLRVRELELA
ncbi:MAG TPA: hypothetical protein VMB73_25590 [Acetobacteraceae bacterium]|nr:hypothetical protein [Acetobacteraceae bacterium]